MNPTFTSPVRALAKPPAGGAEAAPVAPPAGAATLDNEINNPLRIFSFQLALALVFFRVSAFHQAQTMLMHVNLKLLYVVGIPAILGTILCNGVQRAFRKSPAFYWTAYWVWMVAACSTSIWPGDSIRKTVVPYLRTDLIMLFIVAGLIVTWKECLALVKCFAWSAAGSLLVARLFQRSAMERFALDFGTVSNPNDFAAHLLFCLPFLYWVVLTSKSIAVRFLSIAGLAFGVIVIVRTGSRGGLIGVLAVAAMLMVWGSMKQRIAIAALIPVVFLAVVTLVPHATLVRITSFSAGEDEVSSEALQSSEQRRYLLRKSIEYTFKFPLLGVGPGQFANYEGQHSQVIGTHGLWHATHNTFTEVSSECGIPALIFFVAGLLVPFKISYSTFKRARQTPGCEDIRDVMFCTLLSLVGFTVAITFLNFAYFFYEPLLGGWAIAIALVTKEEFANRERAAQSAPVPRAYGPGFPRVVRPAPSPV